MPISKEEMVASAIKSVDEFCREASSLMISCSITIGHIHNAAEKIAAAKLILWTFDRPTIMPEVIAARWFQMDRAKRDCRYVIEACGESDADIQAYFAEVDNFGD